MVSFDTEETTPRLKRSKLYKRIDIASFTVIVIAGLVCAALFAGDSPTEMKFKTACIALLAADLAAIVMYLIFNVFFVFRNSAALKRAIGDIMWEDICAHERLFEGDDVTLRVDFSDDALTLTGSGDKSIYDISALKASPDAYSSSAEILYSCIIAYCNMICERGFKGDVKCIDGTAKEPQTEQLVSCGQPLKKSKYIKKD